MEMRLQKIIANLATLILIFLLMWIVYVTPLDLLKEFPRQAELSTPDEAALKTARYLWNERLLDVVSQAVVVFSAVICALTLFRGERFWSTQR